MKKKKKKKKLAVIQLAVAGPDFNLHPANEKKQECRIILIQTSVRRGYRERGLGIFLMPRGTRYDIRWFLSREKYYVRNIFGYLLVIFMEIIFSLLIRRCIFFLETFRSR